VIDKKTRIANVTLMILVGLFVRGAALYQAMLALALGDLLSYLIHHALLPTGATCLATYPSGSSIQL
jgi:hypothetical protein